MKNSLVIIGLLVLNFLVNAYAPASDSGLVLGFGVASVVIAGLYFYSTKISTSSTQIVKV